MDFTPTIEKKDTIKPLIESAPGFQKKHVAFHKALDRWWAKQVPLIEDLPKTKNVFALRRHFLSSIAEALVPQGILDLHQVRGAVAAYMNRLSADFKSIAASGWGPELMPEEDILQSQFADVLERIEKDQMRIAELEGLFAAADEEEAEPDEETGVLSSEQVKALKEEKKILGGELREYRKNLKIYQQDLKRLDKASALFRDSRHTDIQQQASEAERQIDALIAKLTTIDQQLERHVVLEQELKTLKAHIREVEKKKDELVAAARAKISEDAAKRLILDRFKRCS